MYDVGGGTVCALPFFLRPASGIVVVVVEFFGSSLVDGTVLGSFYFEV